MADPNFAHAVADAWAFTMEMARYGNTPGTVGWYRDQAYVRLFNFRTGLIEWRPFATSRPQPPRPPRHDPFNSRALFEAFR